MWVGGVVEYMSDSWYWWCYYTEGQCALEWSTCQTLNAGGVTILRVNVGCWCSGDLGSVWVGGVVEKI